ncbi:MULTISPECIES: terminase [unclassified Vibrio]|uniref:terminase n=1 Tax=unclassified Vibrio TaxID=2614977 RepID=UPI001360DE2D|nr:MULTISPECIES: terminase [unclassified Vibrio]NAW60058.1 terminase [Vibrio sp. V36_P2S2PM302]NAX25985.1 terminase [Vibrio sp. V38_P2S17PM301]NAX30663.1 terminase [Vibrio sp. V37_P2S8PM304]
MNQEIDSKQAELMLAEDIGSFYNDPLGFVLYAYPWDDDPDLQLVELPEPWASRYKSKYGPDAWFCEMCDDWKEAIELNDFNGKDPVDAFLYAVASGHGIGKSCGSSWIIHFVMSTRPHSKGVVTSNTSDQLKTKTWGELGKWTAKLINKHWFTYNNGKGNMNFFHKEFPQTWRVDAQTCREENSESFAGLHCANSTPWYLFDEASAVPDKIWEVAEGGLTDGEPFWFVFGNPTRNAGRFRECFRKFRRRWLRKNIDSRTVQVTNKSKIAQWLEDYGLDSDFFRVRVRGVFPSASSNQKIPTELLEGAMSRVNSSMEGDVRVMSLDVARGGDDDCVFRFREGLNGRVRKKVVLPGALYRDSMKLAAKAMQLIDEFDPDVFFIDTTGVGGPVADRIRQLNPTCSVFDITFSEASPDPHYANMRAYMYNNLLKWLKAGGCLHYDEDLLTEIGAIEFGHDQKDRELLIKKDDIKKTLGFSPDDADALALLVALPVGPSHRRNRNKPTRNATMCETEYDPYADV